MLRPECVVLGRRLSPCAAKLHQIYVQGSFPLPGAWTGWRIQGRRLIGPGGVTLTPETLRLAAAWVRRVDDDAAAAIDVRGSAEGAAALDARG